MQDKGLTYPALRKLTGMSLAALHRAVNLGRPPRNPLVRAAFNAALGLDQ